MASAAQLEEDVEAEAMRGTRLVVEARIGRLETLPGWDAKGCVDHLLTSRAETGLLQLSKPQWQTYL